MAASILSLTFFETVSARGLSPVTTANPHASTSLVTAEFTIASMGENDWPTNTDAGGLAVAAGRVAEAGLVTDR